MDYLTKFNVLGPLDFASGNDFYDIIDPSYCIKETYLTCFFVPGLPYLEGNVHTEYIRIKKCALLRLITLQVQV